MDLNAACRHATMGGTDHDADALGLEVFNYGICDLNGRPLLNLEPTREDLDETSELGETNDFAIRDISNVGVANDVGKMVFAFGDERDVVDNNHFVIAMGAVLKRF